MLGPILENGHWLVLDLAGNSVFGRLLTAKLQFVQIRNDQSCNYNIFYIQQLRVLLKFNPL